MLRLCIGTVQFGMKYGINNQLGRQPTLNESMEMIGIAIEKGIEYIDTAAAYGDAELILGKYFKDNGISKNIKIISKLKPNSIEKTNKKNSVITECQDSLRRINIEQLDGYLLHTPEYIYDNEILEGMQEIKRKGYSKNIGVSIYNLKEGYEAIKTGLIDYIQLPYSMLDQRGIKSGFIHLAKEAGIKIFTRSSFLQGLFMMDYEKIPAYLNNAIPYLIGIENIIKRYNVDKVSAIMEFVKSETDIDYLVFGIEKKEQLLENIEKYKYNRVPTECIQEIKNKVCNVEESIIFPSLWANGKKVD